MSLKYNSNNSVKSFINLLFNKLPSKDIDNNELNELWNTCDIEVGPESELVNWNYELDNTNNTITIKSFKNTSSTESILYRAYKINDKVYRTKMTKCNAMFKQKSNLTSIEFKPGIDCSNLIDTSEMFLNCTKLTSITGLNNLDTSNATNLGSMFYGCSSLTSVDVTGWNTSKCTNMNSMFYGCTSLTELDLTSWDTSNVTIIHYIFYRCRNLSSIKVSRDKWIINKNCVNDNMFNGCKSSSVTYID